MFRTVYLAFSPAVRAAVKTELSYWNDMMSSLFYFTASKNKHNGEVAMASSSTYVENFNSEEKIHSLLKTNNFYPVAT